ncbi:MAG TPA: very short patch repair endonuclease [Rubrivivax sp.]|nr:very short patch repair endonuclease [Rubrivivax sp.]
MPKSDPRAREGAAPAAGPTPDADPLQTLRRRLHARGLRFGLRRRELPGEPDLVLPKRSSVVFLRGCFWHGHGCALDRSAARFHAGSWAEKIEANQARDVEDRAALRAAGWQVETVWECEVERRGAIERLAARLLRR